MAGAATAATAGAAGVGSGAESSGAAAGAALAAMASQDGEPLADAAETRGLVLDETEEGRPAGQQRRRPAVAATATGSRGRRRAASAVAGRGARSQSAPPGEFGWRRRGAGAFCAVEGGGIAAAEPRAARASCGVGGSVAAWSAAESNGEHHARGQGGLRVVEAGRRDQYGWRRPGFGAVHLGQDSVRNFVQPGG